MSEISKKSVKETLIKLWHKPIKTILLWVILIAVAVCLLFPFYWSFITSITPKEQIASSELSLIPIGFTLEHYKKVFSTIPIFKMLLNTILVTAAGVCTNLFFGSLAAYSFTKLRFKGHKILFKIMLMSMMIPGVITLIPTFLVLLRFPLVGGNDILGNGGIGFFNSLWAVVLPGAIGVYGIFFMKQFFAGISDELAESARMDGASEFRIFAQIYLPLVAPGLATLGIFTFQGGWNNFMWSNIVLLTEENQVLSMAFKEFTSSRGTDFGPLMAVSILMALPVIILFLVMQKYFIEGATSGGVKG